MTAKNYPEVVAKYSEYLKATNYEDESRIFNCAFAAFQAKQYDTAVQFYDMAIQKGYKVDDAYTGKAMALRSLDKAAEFSATVEAGLKANAQNTNLEKLLYGYCMKKAQAAQKAGKLTEAEDLFKDVLVVNNKQYKGNALYSLGVMFYNNGAKILTAANPIAQTEPEKYAAEKKKAEKKRRAAKHARRKGIKAVRRGRMNVFGVFRWDGCARCRRVFRHRTKRFSRGNFYRGGKR